ncbi:MAG: ECF transporter S component [Caldilineaceae bacterium]|nr:ECF transporter S component [Caldilineaceae bacterium]
MQTTQNTPVLSVRRIVITGILAAISILLGVTRIGFIPVPNLTGEATIMHVPVIIGAILEGPVVGTLIGAIFGIYSMLQGGGTMFADPLVSVVPRLFIGVAAYYSYVAVRRQSEYAAIIVSSIVATLTNTILVVGMLIARGYIPAAAIPTIIPQALAEVVIATIITVAVVAAWKNIDGGRKGSSI